MQNLAELITTLAVFMFHGIVFLYFQ